MMIQKPRILISAEWFPPAYKAGGPVQSIIGMVELLVKHAEVWVLAGNQDLGENEPLAVDTNRWLTWKGGAKVRYVTPADLSYSVWKEIMSELQPDWVHLNSMYSLRFSMFPLLAARRNHRIRIVLAPRGMLGAPARSIKPLKKGIFLFFVSQLGALRQVRWHASTKLEQKEIQHFFKRASIAIGQDLPVHGPQENPNRTFSCWKLVVIGRIHRVKNLHFGLKALLESKRDVPLQVDFIGPHEDTHYVNELQAMVQSKSDIQVRFLGSVPPHELTPHYQSAHYLLSSTTQENFGHSIVEAWAHGCPVLISDRTPWRQLAEKNIGWDWPLEEEVWKEGLTQALSIAPEEWERKSQAARDYFSNHVQNAEAEQANLALFDL